MAGIPKVIDTSAVLGVKIFCEDIPAATLVDRPITVEAEFVPGARSAQHVHPHQEESYRVLSGVLDVLVDGRWKRLQPGPENGIYLSLHSMEFRREFVAVRPPDWFLRVLAKVGTALGFKLA